VDETGDRPAHERAHGTEHRGAILKKYRDAALVVDLFSYSDRAPGNRELLFRRVPKKIDGPGYDYYETIWRLGFTNQDVDNLLAFLRDEPTITTPASGPGDPGTITDLLTVIDSKGIDTRGLINALTQRDDLGAVVAALAATDEGLTAAQGALIAERRKVIAGIRALAEDPDSTETDLQHAMEKAYWVFGGHYVGVADRKTFTAFDRYDIPLLSADGTMHIVELKGPNIPNLVRRHRNHWIVGNEVHEATSQVFNYLRTLDGQGPSITTAYRDDFGVDYDMVRLFATVVIGHPHHVKHEDADARLVERTIRSYNAHLSRVEVNAT
jgi:hypothetical protein